MGATETAMLAICAEDVREALQKLLLTRVLEQDGDLVTEAGTAVLAAERVQTLTDSLRAHYVDLDTSLRSDTTLEILVRHDSDLPSGLVGSKPHTTHDPEHGIEYRLGPPTDEYLVFLAHQAKRLGVVGRLFGRFAAADAFRHLPEGGDALDAIRNAMGRRRLTIRVCSTKPMRPGRLRELAQSYAYQVAFNTGEAYVCVDRISGSARSGLRRRTGKIEEIEPPRQIFDSESVDAYHRALAADQTTDRYLALFTILERGFDQALDDELVRAVRDKIRNPGFSSTRARDLRSLGKLAAKLQHATEVGTARERGRQQRKHDQEALHLILCRDVDFERLRADLLDEDHNASDSIAIDWTATTAADQLASRLLDTRDRVRVLRDGRRTDHDALDGIDLARETTLLRLVAEAVISASAAPIGS